MTKLIVTVEGNIGSGKSTYVEALKNYYRHNNKILFLQEPVDMWNTIKDENDKTILENYYENQKKWAFSFQIMAYISRISLLRKAVQSEKYDMIVTERSVYTDRHVFAKMLYEDKKINEIEYQIYLKWFDEFINDLPQMSLIYMKTNPQTAYERVIKRARVGEQIDLSYLENCHAYHESWLADFDKKLVIEGNIDNVENPGITKKWLTEATVFINKSLAMYDENKQFLEN